MISFRGVLQLSFITLSLAQPHGTSTLQWGPCNKTEVPSDVPVDCSILMVPLDYTKPDSNEKLQLDLVRIPAPVKPSRGSILFDFGGPGGTGRDEIGIKTLADELLALTGRQFDLIAFDPRGTRGSKIPIQCFDNEYDAWSFYLDVIPANSSDVELGKQWARASMLVDACLKTHNKTGSLVSSAFVARDMMQIVDALGEDGMLRYWGFSYGTTLGATTAAMFPDRIGRMVLDGVQNPHEYYHAQADFEEFRDADAEFSAMFTGCVAARENCALAKGNNKTAAELEQAVWDLLDAVKYNPVPLKSFLIDYTNVKSFLVQGLYDSSSWPGITSILNAVMTEQYDVVNNAFEALMPTTSIDIFKQSQQPQALASIHCSDNMVRSKTFDDFAPAIQRLYNTSRIIGDGLIFLYSACAQWKIEPKERYMGDFNVKTKNPVLFIGNTFDGLTSLASARNISSTFEASALLTIDGYGHSSLAAPSACTIRATSAYWANGTLPSEGKVCDSVPLYSGITWEDIIQEVYGNTTVSFKRQAPRVPNFGALLAPPAPFFIPR
ncbi:alpha/beta-hydrolase [Daldinia decipiens]|uniref:alpha/beta-hydrolase n=1 Tax=Daldinia decipiens TaxID=326647 RepID=UPI0020C22C5C|nr:alpha/beta-hydrolase [Daldinia decipiens]KAI1653441.1 alpha/beta-hydrolase [Daldinia decipiens]